MLTLYCACALVVVSSSTSCPCDANEEKYDAPEKECCPLHAYLRFAVAPMLTYAAEVILPCSATISFANARYNVLTWSGVTPNIANSWAAGSQRLMVCAVRS